MNHRILSLLSVMALAGSAAAEVAYEAAPNFITPPPGRETIGNGHGDIACDKAGNFYISVQDKDAGVQVYSPEGKYLRTLPFPPSLHGFVLREDEGQEYLYCAVLGEQRLFKAKLDGTVVLDIPKSSFPAGKCLPTTFELKDNTKLAGHVTAETGDSVTFTQPDGTPKTLAKADIAARREGGLKLTNCDVAPNGDIYTVDGYGQNWIFVFDRSGKFKKVFGGPGGTIKLANTHKIFIDRRFSPERIFTCDRGNNRIIHLDLDGNMIGVVADQNMRRPSAAAFHGDLVAVAEIAGRVSVWDKENKLVAELGANPNPKQTNTPKVEPKDWVNGTVTSPHGITFDNSGNILMTEWNIYGRVLRWTAKK